MAVVTGVMSSATSGKAIYDLIAAALGANANWAPATNNPSVSGATDSYGANYTSKIWKCTVGSSVFHVAFSYDITTNVNDLFITPFEAWDGSDGGGVPAAKKLRRGCGGGTTAAAMDNTSVTPGTTDIMNNADQSLPTTSPYSWVANLVGSGSAFSYLYKVGNKDITIGYSVAGANKWVKVGAFESLVTGPSDPMPLGMFAGQHPMLTNKGGTYSTSAHADGCVSRNPGIGVSAETGAFCAVLQPLHVSAHLIPTTSLVTASTRGFGAPVPRWYTKVLMSQAVIHQSRSGGGGAPQTFRGYYPDLFACVINGTTGPTGGGVDSVVIDGVTYYWLGANCIGVQDSVGTLTDGQSILVAVRAD